MGFYTVNIMIVLLLIYLVALCKIFTELLFENINYFIYGNLSILVIDKFPYGKRKKGENGKFIK